MVPFILSLGSKQALHSRIAGGKGASLAWLCRQRFRVPPGFVLTTAAFSAMLAALPEQSGRLSAGLLQGQAMPAAVARATRRAYRRLGGRVAVRSSLVDEDSAAASYAGQLDTVLDVEGEEAVLAAVQQCWASAFSARVARYAAERQGADTTRSTPAVAVVVQRMVPAVSAGVAFSADPDTGQQDVLIEAVHGLGDRLVQGLARPDRFRVDGRGALTEAAPLDPLAPALDHEQALALARLVRQVAQRRGAPQDVEWAWDGEFHLLQSRPITSLAGLHIYSNRMVSDMAPGLVKPFIYSILTVGIAQWVFGRIFTDLIGPNDFDFTRLVPRIRSRVYADMTLMGELLERVGLPPNFLEMMARDEAGASRRPKMGMGSLPTLLRLAHYSWRHARLADELRAFLSRCLPELTSYRSADWSEAAASDLIAVLDRMIALHADLSWHNFMVQINMMGRNRMAKHWLARAAPGVNPDDLVRGLVGSKALEPNAALHALARQGQALGPEMLGRLQAAADETARRAVLAETPAGQALQAAVEQFIATYGHLSTNGSDFSETPWSENPTLIWHAVARTAEQSPDTLLPGPNSKETRKAARLRVRAQLGFVKRRFFDRLLASQVTYIDLRERISDAASLSTHQMRRVVMALAEILVQRGDLAEPNQIFYLVYDEVRDLVAERLRGQEAQARAAARQAEMVEDARVDLPATILGDRVPARPVQLAEGVEYLAGIGGSSGRAQGYARVILEPVHAPADLGPTDILVVPFTDVGWTPLFPGIGGIVAETGGRLSHTSIVAREYGLPAVVSVHHATQLLRDGQPITVDGDAGRVYLRHAPAT